MIKNKLSNQEIVTVAIYALGSGIGTFDIETIAVKADEMAPGRFRWKTRPDLISDSNTWDALSNECRLERTRHRDQDAGPRPSRSSRSRPFGSGAPGLVHPVQPGHCSNSDTSARHCQSGRYSSLCVHHRGTE